MQLVILTALGVGGATMLGAVLGFVFKNIPHKWNDGLLGFAAGVMLCAAVIGLILPACEMLPGNKIWLVGLGILAGALFLDLMDLAVPHLHKLSGLDPEHPDGGGADKVLLFVLAIAIHNLPEGLAAGVAFGGGDTGGALSVAVGIALQNIPEGMVIISPMLLAGIKPARTLFIALCTGFVEVAGTFIGYFAASIAAGILPFALAFAGGTMLYVVLDEMVPETHSHGYEKLASFSMIGGFFLMIVMDTII